MLVKLRPKPYTEGAAFVCKDPEIKHLIHAGEEETVILYGAKEDLTN